MKKIATWTGATALAVLMAGAAPAQSSYALKANVKVTRTPAETVETEASFVSDTRRLDLRCVSASHGRCRIVVESGKARRVLMLTPGQRASLTGVLPTARTCSTGLNPGSPCNWTPVTG